MQIVNNTTQRVIVIANGVALRPGINEVDDEVWDTAVKGPKKGGGMLPIYVKDGTIRVERKVEGKVKRGDAGTFDGMGPDEAQRLVSDTLDRNLLESWHGQVKDPAIQGMITEQLNKVSGPGSDDEKAKSKSKGK